MYSSSSAFLNEPGTLPKLTAHVHTALKDKDLPDPAHLTYTPITQKDIPEIQRLHDEWFPLCYQDWFYTAISQEEVYSLCAWYEGHPLGLITVLVASQSQRPGEFEKILGAKLRASYVRQEAGLSQYFGKIKKFLGYPERDWRIANILTLGVIDEYRRRGLACVLLQKAFQEIGELYQNPKNSLCHAMYLHVIEYNEAACRLYESEGYKWIDTVENFYHLQCYSQDFSAHVYVKYFRSFHEDQNDLYIRIPEVF